MKLLQTEIDVVPGRKPQKQPLPEGMVGQGSCLLRLTNQTSQENAYTVKVLCSNPFWQEDWYTIQPLPPAAGAQAAGPGKSDQIGQGGRFVTLFVTRGGSRDIMINFDAPRRYDSRAGLYPITVQIETRVLGQAVGATRKERFTELKAVVIVRPYHEWAMEVTPETRRVGFFRRGTDYEVAITSQSNDWLYCDVKSSRPKDVILQTPSNRIAIPPPDPGQEQTSRTIPIRAISKLRLFRGEKTPQAVPFSVVRVDAPTVPALPEEASYGPASANCHASVEATEPQPQDLRLNQSEQQLLYCPLVPATLTGCLGAITQNLRGLIMTIIGLLVAASMLSFFYQFTLQRKLVAYPVGTTVEPGGKLFIRGSYLIGSTVWVQAQNETQPTELPNATPVRATAEVPAMLVSQINFSNEQVIAAKMDPKYKDGVQLTVKVRRGGLIPFAEYLLGFHTCSSPVTVGKKPLPTTTTKPFATVNASVEAGKPFSIRGSGFGSRRGSVLVGADEATIRRWDASGAFIQAVAGSAPGDPQKVIVQPVGGSPITAEGTLTVKTKEQIAAQQASGTSTPPPPGPTPGPGTGGGGGGNTAPPVRPRPPAPAPASQTVDVLADDPKVSLAQAEGRLRGNASDPLGLAARGFALLRLEKQDQAREPIRRALELTNGRSGPARALALAASAYLSDMNEQFPNAERQYRDAIAEDPKCLPAYYMYAAFLIDQQKSDQAQKQIRDALRADPTRVRGSRKFRSLASQAGVPL